MSRLYIITGDRGAGKSILCEHLVELAGLAGWQVGGLLSPAVVEAGQKTGIATIDLRTGERCLLVVRRETNQPATELQSDRWSFSAEMMVWGNLAQEIGIT